ncbi:hypothetical protein [Spiroplasma endosymbiont of Panorpa germanica]|uniref:hypothetical protein n=1 Tax=Spiroplasma endosymbiont of Panorpa germanica TaxID=3066314 RepID=UPI0030D2E371
MSFDDFKNTDSEIDLESLWSELEKNKDDEGSYKVKQDSETFKIFDAFMKQNANLTKLKKNADKDILSDVNYKPIIKDGKNPFSKSDINLTELTLVDKINERNDKERIFAIQYVISTDIEILDASFQPLTQKLSYKSSMTFFEDKDFADEVNKISKQVSKAIVSEKYAKSYKIFHNDANLLRVRENIAKLSNFESILKNDISQDITELGSKWSLNTDELNFESSLNWTALSKGRYSGIRSLWNKSAWSKKVKEL